MNPTIEKAFSASNAESVFSLLLPALGEVMKCDRVFLLLRQPQTRLYKNLCWRKNVDIPDTSTQGWQQEEEWEKDDPMFAAALQLKDSIFVEDIETASSDVLNREFERKYLKHRALIHAHLRQNGQLWGILQPSVFGHPRVWSESDIILINQVVEKLTPIVVNYIKTSL